MSPLLPPRTLRRHQCTPPLEERRIRPPGVTTGGHVEHRPPAPGSTWNCPVCTLVWIVVERPGRGTYRGRPRYGQGYSASSRAWIRASRRQARRHFARLAQVKGGRS